MKHTKIKTITEGVGHWNLLDKRVNEFTLGKDIVNIEHSTVEVLKGIQNVIVIITYRE